MGTCFGREIDTSAVFKLNISVHNVGVVWKSQIYLISNIFSEHLANCYKDNSNSSLLKFQNPIKNFMRDFIDYYNSFVEKIVWRAQDIHRMNSEFRLQNEEKDNRPYKKNVYASKMKSFEKYKLAENYKITHRDVVNNTLEEVQDEKIDYLLKEKDNEIKKILKENIQEINLYKTTSDKSVQKESKDLILKTFNEYINKKANEVAMVIFEDMFN